MLRLLILTASRPARSTSCRNNFMISEQKTSCRRTILCCAVIVSFPQHAMQVVEETTTRGYILSHHTHETNRLDRKPERLPSEVACSDASYHFCSSKQIRASPRCPSPLTPASFWKVVGLPHAGEALTPAGHCCSEDDKSIGFSLHHRRFRVDYLHLRPPSHLMTIFSLCPFHKFLFTETNSRPPRQQTLEDSVT